MTLPVVLTWVLCEERGTQSCWPPGPCHVVVLTAAFGGAASAPGPCRSYPDQSEDRGNGDVEGFGEQ